MDYKIENVLKRAGNWVWYIVYLAYCKCRFGRDVRLIKLGKGKFAIVDRKNYERLSKYNWRAMMSNDVWYAVRWVWKCEKSNKTIQWMHLSLIHI